MLGHRMPLPGGCRSWGHGTRGSRPMKSCSTAPAYPWRSVPTSRASWSLRAGTNRCTRRAPAPDNSGELAPAAGRCRRRRRPAPPAVHWHRNFPGQAVAYHPEQAVRVTRALLPAVQLRSMEPQGGQAVEHSATSCPYGLTPPSDVMNSPSPDQLPPTLSVLPRAKS